MSSTLIAPSAGNTVAGETVIEVSGLSKSFGEIHALDNMSLKVERGITYGLLGPNGAGKTTLIRTLAGLITPDAGAARVLGHELPRQAAAVWPRIGYMTQSAAIYADLTVRENVDFFAHIFGLKGTQQRRARVDAVLELVELDKRGNELVANLSGGMKQRVSLACALVHQPALLLLDEPTVGVDPALRAQFWNYFRSLNTAGVTIVVSSHVMDEAERCDRLGMILYGQLLAEGTAHELRARAGTSTLEEAFLAFSGSRKEQ